MAQDAIRASSSHMVGEATPMDLLPPGAMWPRIYQNHPPRLGQAYGRHPQNSRRETRKRPDKPGMAARPIGLFAARKRHCTTPTLGDRKARAHDLYTALQSLIAHFTSMGHLIIDATRANQRLYNSAHARIAQHVRMQ